MLPIILNTVAMVFFIAGYAFAGGAEGGGGLISHLFMGFLGLIVVGQLIPGLILFGSMCRGLFSRVANSPSR